MLTGKITALELDQISGKPVTRTTITLYEGEEQEYAGRLILVAADPLGRLGQIVTVNVALEVNSSS